MVDLENSIVRELEQIILSNADRVMDMHEAVSELDW